MPPKRLTPFLVKKIGNWDGAIDFFKQMGYRVKTVSLQSQQEICKDLRDRVIKHILAQDMGWEPLAKSTQRIKNQNHKTDVYLDTELYIHNIITWRVGNTFLTGIKKGIAYNRKGSFANVDRIAALNEFGSAGDRVPVRPLWEPTIMELGGPKGIQNYVANKIYLKLKAQSRSTPVQITKRNILDKIR